MNNRKNKKAALAGLISLLIFLAIILVFKLSIMGDRLAELERLIGTRSSAHLDQDEGTARILEDLESRLTKLEEAMQRRFAIGASPPGTSSALERDPDLVGQRVQLTKMREDLNSILELRAGLRRVIEALAPAARGTGNHPGLTEGEAAQPAGVASIKSRAVENMTDEQRARFDEVNAALRQLAIEEKLQELNGLLEEKLTDGQRLGIANLLNAESLAVLDIREQELTEEERRGFYNELLDQTDESVKTMLSEEQYVDWSRRRSALREPPPVDHESEQGQQ